MAFRILSWNIETFGETKLGGLENLIARVIHQYQADLVFILESTTQAQGDLASQIANQLEAATGESWLPFGSDPTGKSHLLPKTITTFPKACDLTSYRGDLLRCYTEPSPGHFVCKDNNASSDIIITRTALERAGVLRRDLETYTGLFRYDPGIYSSQLVHVALGSWVALSRYRGLESEGAQGNEIGYANPTSGFNGRRPYLANLYFASPANPRTVERWFPVVCFHAPFGTGGERTRVPANVGLMNLATPALTGTKIALRDQSVAAVCGDFNVSYDWNEDFSGLTLPIPASKTTNAQNYGAFYAADFRMTIGELTSLKAINPILKPVTDPVAFRSSAYDNVIVRATPGSPITNPTGAAIDMIGDVYGASHGGNYLTGTPLMPTTPRPYDAFVYVRKRVSDHLPVLCTLQVPGRP